EHRAPPPSNAAQRLRFVARRRLLRRRDTGAVLCPLHHHVRSPVVCAIILRSFVQDKDVRRSRQGLEIVAEAGCRQRAPLSIIVCLFVASTDCRVGFWAKSSRGTIDVARWSRGVVDEIACCSSTLAVARRGWRPAGLGRAGTAA